MAPWRAATHAEQSCYCHDFQIWTWQCLSRPAGPTHSLCQCWVAHSEAVCRIDQISTTGPWT